MGLLIIVTTLLGLLQGHQIGVQIFAERDLVENSCKIVLWKRSQIPLVFGDLTLVLVCSMSLILDIAGA